MAVCLARHLGLSTDALDYGTLLAKAKGREQVLFVTATDGNHGRGVAWAARMLGQKARVYLPKGTAQARLDNILKEGAEASITDLAYDDAVQLAARVAREEGGILVQDTSWEGYEDIPLLILQGYTTLAREVVAELADSGQEAPTHIFLQAGVGSFASALAAAFAQEWPHVRFVVAEPCSADCLWRTARANDQTLHAVEGEMTSMMAGLCCGVPSLQAWQILEQLPVTFVRCEDDAAMLGMRLLASPLGRGEQQDPLVVSGESGAVTTGLLAALMLDDAQAAVRETLGLDAHSRVLLVSTEGCTDPVNYEHVVGMAIEQ